MVIQYYSSVSCRHINLFIKAIQSRRAMRSTLYWCVVLLYRANSLIRHIGVLFSEMVFSLGNGSSIVNPGIFTFVVLLTVFGLLQLNLRL